MTVLSYGLLCDSAILWSVVRQCSYGLLCDSAVLQTQECVQCCLTVCCVTVLSYGLLCDSAVLRSVV